MTNKRSARKPLPGSLAASSGVSPSTAAATVYFRAVGLTPARVAQLDAQRAAAPTSWSN